MTALPEKTAELQLEAVLDLNAAAGLRADLLSRRGADLVIDASMVQRVGAQCLQVLIAAGKTWQHDGQNLSIGAASPGFLTTLQLTGLDAGRLLAKEN